MSLEPALTNDRVYMVEEAAEEAAEEGKEGEAEEKKAWPRHGLGSRSLEQDWHRRSFGI